MNRPPLPLAAHERLIFALDVPGHDEAIAWVDRLGESVAFYKIGMDMWGVKIAGDHAFVHDTHNGIFVIDIADPAKPRFVARA